MKKSQRSRINDAYRGEKIAKELFNEFEKSISDEDSSLEFSGLKQLMHDSSETSALIKRLCDSNRAKTFSKIITQANQSKKQDIERLKKRLERRQIIRWLTLSGVASSVAVAVFFAFFYYIHPAILNQQSSSEPQTPMLIVDNQSQFNLNESLTGVNGVQQINNRKIRISENSLQIKQNRIVIPSRYTYTVILSDGTEVTLNAASELSYPSRFSDSCRQVTLHGEAFFNVAHNKIPFVVHTDNLNITVHGTQFNVNTHFENRVEATLVEGSVSVSDGDVNQMMSPGESLSYEISSKTFQKKKTDVDKYISWMQGVWYYQNCPLYRIIADMERWYGININYSSGVDLNLKITLNIKRTLEPDEMIEFIESVTGLTINKRGACQYMIE